MGVDPEFPSLLSVGFFPDPAIAILEKEFQIHRLWGPGASKVSLDRIARDIRFIQTTGTVGVARILLDQCPRLEIIACSGTGTDRIDLEECRKRSIVVTNTPGVMAEDVADLAMGLAIMAARKLVAADAFARSGAWRQGSFPLTTRVFGRRMGVFGYGRVGRAIARRGLAFGMEIGIYDPFATPPLPDHVFGSLLDLARWAEILVVSCPLANDTEGAINAEVLDTLGCDGILINVARGPVVDQDALTEALRTGSLGSAGVDVLTSEPVIPEALAALPNIAFSPHIGSATGECRAEMAAMVTQSLLAHKRGESVPHRVL